MNSLPPPIKLAIIYCNYNFPKEYKMTSRGIELFKTFMTQIQPDQATRDYLIGVIANAITGHRNGNYTYIFHGPTSANGKSVLTLFLDDMLGDYCSWYDTDALKRDAREAEPYAKSFLENRRLVIGMTPSDVGTIKSELFKQYFIADSYRAREKYKHAYTVKSTHTMFLSVNQIPKFESDPEVRRHLVVIPFTERFVEDPNPNNPHEHQRDPNILEQLIAHEDEIFTYLVHIAETMREKNIKLEIPASIKEYTSRMLDKNKQIWRVAKQK